MSDGIKRRDFLKVLGVTGAGAATLAGCSTKEPEKLLPYVTPPDDVTPGVATWYTSVCQECPAGCGVWTKTREGRVVKLEGNPRHPVSRGALCQRGHAALQGIYNPDRFTGPMVRENGELKKVTWEDAEKMLAQRIQGAAGNVMLVSGTAGPSLSDLFDSFISKVGGTRVRYDAFSEAPLREAARIAFGQAVVPRYDFEQARLIVSFGADFLETFGSPVEYGRGFARASAVDAMGSKARFVAVTPHLSLTGLNADDWMPIKPGAEAAVALAMASILAQNGGGDAGPYAAMLREFDARSAAEAAGVDAQDIEQLAERFVSEGPSVAVGPGVGGQHRNATAANVAVLVLNAVAGSVGKTVHLQTGWTGLSDRPFAEVQSAIQAMSSGAVGVAMVHGANPAFTLPPAAGFAEAFGAVPFKVSFATAPDETAALADLILPDTHYLESWGDSNPRPGLWAIQQPAMRPVPLFDAKSTGDVLIQVATQLGQPLDATSFHDHVQTRWQQLQGQAAGNPDASGDFGRFWRLTLKKGVLEVPVQGTETIALRSPDSPLSFDPPQIDGEGLDFTLLVYPSSRLYDGRGANKPWLQELPDPATKITWDSWVEINPATCERLGLVKGDVVTITSPHGSLEVAVWPYPGIREDAIAIPTGGGHTSMGRYADGFGVNPMQLLPAEAEQPSGALVQMATRVSVEPTGQQIRFADIEGADTQHNRPIAPAVALSTITGGPAGGTEPAMAEGEEAGAEGEGEEGTRQELQLFGGFVPTEVPTDPTGYPEPGAQYGMYSDAHQNEPRWAMAIDLDKCTGCSACVVACQAENNVPFVGIDQVRMGREMHWIRLERYYQQVDATRAAPLDVRFLPMLCQQCGNAPCEPVCPVYAAYHTPDGINGQVYNRCVGTRYCANNCPYKVRVFNWYTFTDVPEPLNWQYNPDVTVRQNGVMEKCTFCVQRIRQAQNRAAVEGRPLNDDEIVPACAQTCPTEAITFGNVRDEKSAVAQEIQNTRTYRVLDEEINTQPGVSYLKKVTFHAVEAAE